MRRVFFITMTGLAALGMLTPAARAAERVILSNGFEMNCKHHAQDEQHIRVYLSSGDDNYMDFTPREIAAFEQVPDPPSQPVAPGTRPETAPKATPDGSLTPVDLREMLSKAGHEHNLDVDLLASVVKAESGGNARAVSRTGARGLMQLMPGTANDLGVKDSFRPDQNVQGGSVYLDILLTRYHDNMALALAAYNAGPAAVDKYRGIPPYRETQAYVARVIHEFNRRVRAREAQARRAVASTSTAQSRASR